MNYNDTGVSFDRDSKLKSIFEMFNVNTNGFAGSMPLYGSFKDPILISTTDGVGTKILLAKTEDDFYKIGIDLFAANANDILTYGAKPLFFLDYIATNKFNPNLVKALLNGLNDECKKLDCKILGGESAELPNFYTHNSFDIAGFCVSVMDKKKIIEPKNIKVGDVLIGLESSGFHANGYSLIREVLFKKHNFTLEDTWPNKHKTIKDVLLTPTKVYTKSVLALKNKVKIKGLANVTGGGILGNLKRILPKNLKINDFNISQNTQIFDDIAKLGKIDHDEIKRVFNLGIGYLLVISKEDINESIDILSKMGEVPHVLDYLGNC